VLDAAAAGVVVAAAGGIGVPLLEVEVGEDAPGVEVGKPPGVPRCPDAAPAPPHPAAVKRVIVSAATARTPAGANVRRARGHPADAVGIGAGYGGKMAVRTATGHPRR
jgi:hypothetical protein